MYSVELIPKTFSISLKSNVIDINPLDTMLKYLKIVDTFNDSVKYLCIYNGALYVVDSGTSTMLPSEEIILRDLNPDLNEVVVKGLRVHENTVYVVDEELPETDIMSSLEMADLYDGSAKYLYIYDSTLYVADRAPE